MKVQAKQLWSLSFLLLFQLIVTAQGLPPGWDFNSTPTTHIVAIPLECEPNINGWLVNPGDWIGAFYIDDEGEYACGGAVEWEGDQNTGLIAFGDDGFTTEKDGFDSGETINWKVYSWSVEKAYNAEVTCDSTIPSPCNVFTPNGLSGIATFNAAGYYIYATAQPDSVCIGNAVQLNANASGGSGAYTYSWVSNPAGFTSDIANPTVIPFENTDYTVEVSDAGELLSNTVTVNVFSPPEVSAGGDITICENEIVSLNGTVTNSQSFIWTTNGDGSFSNPSIQDPDYTPGAGDISNGMVLLTLTAQPIEPCSVPVSSNLQLFISGLPQVSAGEDQTICEDHLIQLTASASNYSSLLWTTSGDGSFNDPSIPDAVYTPGSNDLANGNVNLEIEINPIAPCTGVANDFISIAIIILPVVNAGDNVVVCEDGTAELSGEAENFVSVLWVSTGDGIFSDPTSLNTTYAPGTNDILSGEAMLSLIAQPQAPCIEPISDNLNLIIVMLPTVNAGADATVCEDGDHQLNASATNFEEVIWSTAGDGFFGDPNSLSTSYTPGPDDIFNGEVVLTLTALPEFPCSVNTDDGLLLTIMNLPDVNAGDDSSVCEDQALQLNASVTGFNSLMWITAGDGTFNDPTIPDAIYTPGSNDISSGEVALTLVASPLFPCVTNIEDDLVLSIVYFPEVNAGEDATICEDNTHQLDGQVANYLIFQWVSSGDGDFNNITILNPVYTPGIQDIEDGTVVLSLTAIPISPCIEMQQSDLNLSLIKLPVADAGPDAIVPWDDVYQLAGDAENYSTVLWATSGDGVFSDTGILDPFYTPGEQDIAITEVTLTLTANPLTPCTLPMMDDMILEIDTIIGIVQITNYFDLKVFPNPSGGQLQIVIPPHQGNSSYSLKVHTLVGKLLKEDLLENNAGNNEMFIPLNLSTYPNGVYLISIITDKKFWHSKVILNKE